MLMIKSVGSVGSIISMSSWEDDSGDGGSGGGGGGGRIRVGGFFFIFSLVFFFLCLLRQRKNQLTSLTFVFLNLDSLCVREDRGKRVFPFRNFW